MRGRNVGKDVRPLADRKRDHERVKKISSNCYALMWVATTTRCMGTTTTPTGMGNPH